MQTFETRVRAFFDTRELMEIETRRRGVEPDTGELIAIRAEYRNLTEMAAKRGFKSLEEYRDAKSAGPTSDDSDLLRRMNAAAGAQDFQIPESYSDAVAILKGLGR